MPDRKEAGKRCARPLSLIPSPYHSDLPGSQRAKEPGDAIGRVSPGKAEKDGERTGEGPMEKPCAHPGTAHIVTCPLPVATQLQETASLSAACPGPCPDPTVHPRSGREARIHPHSGGAWTLLPRPNGNGFWIIRHLAGLSAPLPPTVPEESQEGPGLSLVFQDDLAES